MEANKVNSVLQQEYQLNGVLNTIYSELDAVYTLTTADQKKYVIKVSNPSRDASILDMETDVLGYLQNKIAPFEIQHVVPNTSGQAYVKVDQHHIRVFEWIHAELMAECNPLDSGLRKSIGQMLATISNALKDYDHSSAHRFMKWNPTEILWIRDHVKALPAHCQHKFTARLDHFEQEVTPILAQCPLQIIYGDGNDYNILCRWHHQEKNYNAVAVIDWLDMVYTHRINELAIGCAYAIMKTANPLDAATDLIAAYHFICPLTDEELAVLYTMIHARLMISVTVSAINKSKDPENLYLQVSDHDAWDLLEKWDRVHPRLAHYTFRVACNKEAIPDFEHKVELLKSISTAKLLPIMTPGHQVFDFSIDSSALGNYSNYINDLSFSRQSDFVLKEHGVQLGIGKYNEVRPFYTTDGFQQEGNEGPEWRTVHLGLDLFSQPGSTVQAVYKGKVHSFKDNTSSRDYGPTVILEHTYNDFVFYTLYGHLSKSSLIQLKKGSSIQTGDIIGTIGALDENGGWPPHLHFQIILDLFDQEGDFPGVVRYKDKKVWAQISPDPVWLTNIQTASDHIGIETLLSQRKATLGFNLSISYKNPLWILRGQGQYLLDHTGRRYLDTVNNVAHCGHEHPSIVDRGQKAMAVLNTNTRYLHENIVQLADQLRTKLHPSLSVCYFTNSGSEANELAIRMAKTVTGSKDFITMQWGYHGNTNALIDLSSYKFDRKGGQGKPLHTHVIPMPDPFRGIYAHQTDELSNYLIEIKSIIQRIQSTGSKPAALFAEAILSCGGQVVYPSGFLKSAVELIRHAGGIYIADEVQTGLGRVGRYFNAYELYEVIPDIVTFGKPLGNGHPIGAVVCTQEIAQAFNNGMEYFNTFGGNPVSCAIACEVLHVIEIEDLMHQATHVGDFLKTGLNDLSGKYPILKDIRGYGYFLGIELMKYQKPATIEANYLTAKMKEYGILMSTDGPDDNVIKFKPPMCFNIKNAEELLGRLEQVLKFDFLKGD